MDSKNGIYLILLLVFSSLQQVYSSEGPVKYELPRIKNSTINTRQADPRHKILFHSVPPDFVYNEVRCIFKDYKGFIWFGTANGLIRFDGINLKVYTHDEDLENSLVYNVINAIEEDKNNNLWIGTSNGLCLYDLEKDNFTGLNSLDENIERLSHSYIKALCVDENNCLWIGTFGFGLNAYDIEKQVLFNYTSDSADVNSISSTRITSLVTDFGNNLWIGTQNGLNLFHRGEKSFTRFMNDPRDPSSLKHNNITFLEVDPYDNLWIGTMSGGLDRLIIKGKNGYSFEHFTNKTPGTKLSSDYIHSLYADKAGYLWIGTDNGGLNQLDIKTGAVKVFKTEEGNELSINSNSVWSIFGDSESRIWIGTYNKGINVIDGNLLAFESYKQNPYLKTGLPDNDVTGFTEDKQGKVWIATDGGGICRFDMNTGQFDKIIHNTNQHMLLSNNFIVEILYDSHDHLWVGSWGGGVDRLINGGRQSVHYNIENENGVGNNYVTTIYEDNPGNIWVGTSGSGLFLYNKEDDHFIPVICKNTENVLTKRSYISSITSDSENTLWIATTNGLVHLNFQQGRNKECICKTYNSINSGISNDNVNIVFFDSNDQLWIGTAENGLNLFNKNDNTFSVFLLKDGLPGNSIKGILEDNKVLWISTDRGISRFDPQKRSFKNYSKEDGLNSNEYYSNSCLKTKNGAFFFGGEEGFNTFYPDRIKTNRHIPMVILTGLRINNVPVEIGAKDSPLHKQISETKEIVLKHYQSSFSIDFVALNYTRPAKNQFCYKLEGFDKDWNCIGTLRSANYTNIMPGDYTFKVKGSNNDGLWNETLTELTVIIEPPFWKTWWAYMFYMIALLTVIAVSLKIWYERINIKNQLKLAKLAKEKEHELNELNIQFFTNISHEFRTPLSLIIGPLESLINSTRSVVRDQLLVIQRNAGRLLHLTNNLMDLQKLEEGVIRLKIQQGDILDYIKKVSDYFSLNFNRRKINFSIETKETSILGWFDAEKLETIVLNLLSNATKYTPDGGSIRIKASSYGSFEARERFGKYLNPARSAFRFLEVMVIDYGKGIMQEELPYIFDKFYQAGSEEISKKSGTGIGLTLTKGLIEMHHGRIWAESHPGKETCFTFILPMDRMAYYDDEIVNRPVNAVEREIIPHMYDAVQSSEEDSAKGDENDERPEILIVEDNDELRAFLAKELSMKFKIIKAEDGKQGIALALKEIPDLIVSDVLMPHSSGIDLCKTIRSDMRTCHIPVILLTAKSTINDQIEGIETGADIYITKPFNIRFLLTQINHLIQSRRELYAHFSKEVYIIPNKMANKEMDEMFLQKAIDYILQNISESKFNIEGLANHLNMSHSAVYRKIKALTGNTVIDFIRTVRLKQALKLMETKKYNLAEISYLTGFTSPSYFTKTFREYYGNPPSDYLTDD